LAECYAANKQPEAADDIFKALFMKKPNFRTYQQALRNCEENGYESDYWIKIEETYKNDMPIIDTDPKEQNSFFGTCVGNNQIKSKSEGNNQIKYDSWKTVVHKKKKNNFEPNSKPFSKISNLDQ